MMNYTNDTWIPVTSFLPHEHERVLVVCYNLQNHNDVHVSIATYFGKRDGQPIWSGKKKVSHWMVLPEIPNDAPSKNWVTKEYLKEHHCLR